MLEPTFSERMGLKSAKALQVRGMDRALRVGLWNALTDYLHELRRGLALHSGFEGALRRLIWTGFLEQTADRFPDDSHAYHESDKFWEIIRKWYFSDEAIWTQTYEFFEFIVRYKFDYKTYAYFETRLNVALERENAAYRLVNGKFGPITNEEELQAVRGAVNPPTTALQPVSTHIQQALELLSDKTNPDYRNSMKEAISAVESLCKLIVGPQFKTLAPALEKTTKELGMNAHLRDGFKEIFQYTNDDHGIRHGLKDNEQPDQEDARFMLVACSAFVNYITEKARKQNKLPN